MGELKKSRIWETLNVLMCADCSTNTKTDKSNQKGDIREKCVMCYLSHVTFYVSHVNAQISDTGLKQKSPVHREAGFRYGTDRHTDTHDARTLQLRD